MSIKKYQQSGLLIFLLLTGIISFSTAISIDFINPPALLAVNEVPEITAEELQKLPPQSIFLIDVRTPEEYEKGHIGNSPLIPLQEIEAGTGIEKLLQIIPKPAENTTIVLYCANGPRSIKAYRKLEGTGLNLMILKGGINVWRKTISPLEDEQILAPLLNNQLTDKPKDRK